MTACGGATVRVNAHGHSCEMTAEFKSCASTSMRYVVTTARFTSSSEIVGEFPLNTYRGAKSFIAAFEPFSRLVKKIDVVRLVADGEHCVAILNIDTVFGLIPFAEHIHVVDGQIVSVRGFYDPRPLLSAVGDHDA